MTEKQFIDFIVMSIEHNWIYFYDGWSKEEKLKNVTQALKDYKRIVLSKIK